MLLFVSVLYYLKQLPSHTDFYLFFNIFGAILEVIASKQTFINHLQLQPSRNHDNNIAYMIFCSTQREQIREK